MSTHKYLDTTGLGQVWEKIKNITLVRNNTTSYIPTSDYNPATKKYVDDAISNISCATISEIEEMCDALGFESVIIDVEDYDELVIK